MSDELVRQRVGQYLAWAHQALRTARLTLEHEDYITTVNRAYYAIFYAANALLTIRGLERSRHSGVIAAFRQHFVKTGIIGAEYSEFYGVTMEDRHSGDYGLVALSPEVAVRDLERAERFVTHIGQLLQEMGIIS